MRTLQEIKGIKDKSKHIFSQKLLNKIFDFLLIVLYYIYCMKSNKYNSRSVPVNFRLLKPELEVLVQPCGWYQSVYYRVFKTILSMTHCIKLADKRADGYSCIPVYQFVCVAEIMITMWWSRALAREAYCIARVS